MKRSIALGLGLAMAFLLTAPAHAAPVQVSAPSANNEYLSLHFYLFSMPALPDGSNAPPRRIPASTPRIPARLLPQ